MCLPPKAAFGICSESSLHVLVVNKVCDGVSGKGAGCFFGFKSSLHKVFSGVSAKLARHSRFRHKKQNV